MVLMTLRAEFKGRKLAVTAALLVASGIASATTKSQSVPAPVPAVRIPTSSLGYTAPSAAYLSYRYALSTLDFIDNTHLLFTFHVNRLMERIPNDDAKDNDQIIHAEVVDIASGTVTQQADWRMHDRQRYLWALNGGQFLVRQRNSLFLTDSQLVLHPYLTFDSALQAIEISPDRKLMLIEIEKVLPKGPETEAKGPSLLGTGSSVDAAGLTAQPQKRTELVLVHPGDKAVVAKSEAMHAVELPLNDDGFIEVEEGKDANQWVLRKTYFNGEPKEFGMVRSTCMPELLALSQTVTLTIHCSANRTAGNKVVTALSTEKGTLWTDVWQDKYIWPSFAYTTDGSRYVYESLEMNRPIGIMDGFGEEDVKSQPVGVFDTESGKLELVENAAPILTGGRNYALSADGQRFAILRDGAIEVYDLPPVEAVTEKGKKK
jgi:hypothetical protein